MKTIDYSGTHVRFPMITASKYTDSPITREEILEDKKGLSSHKKMGAHPTLARHQLHPTQK